MGKFLVLNAVGALEKYHEVNGTLPDRIIVYRDGVGDGQLAAVFEHEVQQMCEAFQKAGGQGYMYVQKLTKQHHQTENITSIYMFP